MHAESFEISSIYRILRPLSDHSTVYLCNEPASNRLVVLKLYSEQKYFFFLREMEALRDLDQFSAAPKLLTAQKTDSSYAIVMEHLNGTPLHKFVEDLKPDEFQYLYEETKKTLNHLHQTYRFAHGDLNFNNIVIKRDKQRTYKVSFIDWEFSINLDSENIENYNKFRGTLGITPCIESHSLIERDLKSLEEIFTKLGTKMKTPPVKAGLIKRMTKWI